MEGVVQEAAVDAAHLQLAVPKAPVPAATDSYNDQDKRREQVRMPSGSATIVWLG